MPFCKYWKDCPLYYEEAWTCNEGEHDMNYCGYYAELEGNEVKAEVV